MPRINFQQQLVALKDKLLAMAALSQQALEFSVEAYLAADMTLCDHVLEIEAAINSAETSVDDMAYDLLAKEQPMAIDLRFILSVIKINSDLERIGDQSTNIARRAQSLRDAPQISLAGRYQGHGRKSRRDDPHRHPGASRSRCQAWPSPCSPWMTKSTR